MKRFFFFLIIFFCSFFVFLHSTYAGDPFCIMMNGHYAQDILSLIEVTSVNEDKTIINAKIIFNFPQSKDKKNNKIELRFDKTNNYLLHPDNITKTIEVGKKYMVSLEKKIIFTFLNLKYMK